MTALSTTPPSGTLRPRQRVDAYEVVRLLGEGGMGRVYLARDTTLGRDAALKVLRPVEGVALDALVAEAQTTARFAHPNIVAVYGAGRVDGAPYVAFEYLDGESLRERLSRGPLPPSEALGVARAVADALGEAHAHGVLHRDIKPDNVFLPRDGRVRVLDFGLALPAGTAGVSGRLVGTVPYLAPELWAGAAATPAADVWALGVLLYEALVGARPYADTAAALPPEFDDGAWLAPLWEHAAGFAAIAEDVIARCLARDPNARPTARDVAATLARMTAPGTGSRASAGSSAAAIATRAAPPAIRGSWVGGAVAGGLVAAAIVLARFIPPRAAPAPTPVARAASTAPIAAPVAAPAATPPAPPATAPQPTVQRARVAPGRPVSRASAVAVVAPASARVPGASVGTTMTAVARPLSEGDWPACVRIAQAGPREAPVLQMQFNCALMAHELGVAGATCDEMHRLIPRTLLAQQCQASLDAAHASEQRAATAAAWERVREPIGASRRAHDWPACVRLTRAAPRIASVLSAQLGCGLEGDDLEAAQQACDELTARFPRESPRCAETVARQRARAATAQLAREREARWNAEQRAGAERLAVERERALAAARAFHASGAWRVVPRAPDAGAIGP